MRARGLGKAKLGRGEGSIGSRAVAEELLAQAGAERLDEVPLAAIEPNPWQCRSRFRPHALHELADAIDRDGLLHPLVVRPLGDGRYQLASGERRLRAVRLLGWRVVPVRVREFSDRQMRRVAWAENMARDDLSAWEQAQAVLEARRDLKNAGEPSHQRAVAEELGISLGSANEMLRVARAFSAEAVSRAEAEGDDLPDENAQATKAKTIHDIPREQLVRVAKLDTEEERDAWLREWLDGGRPKGVTRPRQTSVSVPLDPISCSPSRAREMALTLLTILPDLIRRGAGDPADAQALGTAAAVFWLNRLGGPSFNDLTGHPGADSDAEAWLRELRRRADGGSTARPAA